MTYTNFELSLVLDNGNVTEECNNSSAEGGPKKILISHESYEELKELYLSSLRDTDEVWYIDDFVDEGIKIANVLIPEGQIREGFIELLQAHSPLRICIHYPLSDPDSVRKLLEIPWELAYIALDRETAQSLGVDKDYPFLGMADKVSIVHSLALSSAENSSSYSSKADERDLQLPVKVHYLGWFKDEGLTQSLFDDFEQEFTVRAVPDIIKLDNFQFNNFHRRKVPIAEPASVTRALQDADLVHIICHGDGDSLQLDGDNLTVNDLKSRSSKFKARAAVLVSCNSGDGAMNIARTLHEEGVPLVIGMTNWIHFDDADRFIDGFYKAFTAHPYHDLESIISAGRREMFKEGKEGSAEYRVSWFFPRLFMSGSESQLIHSDKLFGSNDLLDRFNDIIGRSAQEIIAPEGLEERIDPKPQIDSYVKKLLDWARGKLSSTFFCVKGPSENEKEWLVTNFISEMQNHPAKDDPLLAYHFCNINDSLKITSSFTFVKDSLIPQLEGLLGEEYRGSKVVKNAGFPYQENNIKEALKDFVIQPLIELNRKLVIIINDIDFVHPKQDPDTSILSFVKQNIDWLRSHGETLRLIVTGLDPLTKLDTKARHNLDLATHAKLVTALNGLSDQDGALFLFSQMKQNILNNKLLHNTFYKDSPQGGSHVLYDWIIKTTKAKYSDSEEEIKSLLDIIALAYEPLLPCDAAALIGVECSAVINWLEMLKPLFREYSPETPLVFSHSSIEKYLLRKIESENRAVAVHNLFVDAFRPQDGWAQMMDWINLCGSKWQQRRFPDKCIGQISNESAKNSPMEPMARYVRRYLVHHAHQAFLESESDRYLDLISDPGYRTVRFFEAGLEEALQDIRKGVANKNDSLKLQDINDEKLKEVEKKLRRGEVDKSIFSRVEKFR